MSDHREKCIRIRRRRGRIPSTDTRAVKRRRRRIRGGAANNDLISNLPLDVGRRILNQLYPFDLLRAGRTCRAWRGLVASVLWQRIAEPAVSFNQEKLFRVYARSYMSWCRQPINQAMSCVHWPVGIESPFGLFCLCFTKDGGEFMANNSGCEVSTVCSGSGQTIYKFKELFSCAVYAAPVMYLGWLDIAGFDCESRECVHTFRGHKGNVLCMQVHDNLLASGSMDRSVRLWDTASGNQLGLFLGHAAPVYRIVLKNKYIISVSSDAIVKVWTQQSLECIHSLDTGFGEPHVPASLDFDGVRLAFVCDNHIEVWKVVGEVLSLPATQRYEQIHLKVTSVKFIDGTGSIAVGFGDGSMQIWDLGSGRISTIGAAVQIEPSWQIHFDHSVGGFLVHYEFLVSWTRSGVVNLYDRASGAFIRCLLNLPQDVVGGTTEAVGSIVGLCAHKCRLIIALSIGNFGSRFKMYNFTPR